MAAQHRPARQKRIDLQMVGEAGDVVALVAEGFTVPDLNAAGHAAERGGFSTTIASPSRSLVSGRSGQREEMNFVVDKNPGDISAADHAGLILPGGDHSVERLMKDQDARLLVHDFLKSGKPVFAAGAAVRLLAEISEKEGFDTALAALAMKGEVFAGESETAVEDAAAAFGDALSVLTEADAA